MSYLDYALSLNPVLARDFSRGDVEDKTGYNRAWSVVNSPTLARMGGLYSLAPGSARDGALAIDYGTEQDLTTSGTIIVCYPKILDLINQYLVSKYDATGNSWTFVTLAAKQLRISSSSHLSPVINCEFRGSRVAGVTWGPSYNPRFFLDGKYVGQGLTSFVGDVSMAKVYICNSYSGIVPAKGVTAVFAFASELEDLDHARIAQDFIREKSRIVAPQLSRPIDQNVTGQILKIRGKVESNQVVDEAQNLRLARSGEAVVHGSEYDSPVGRYVKGSGRRYGDAYLGITDTSLNNISPITISGWVRPSGAQETLGTVYAKNADFLHLQFSDADGRVYFSEKWDDGGVFTAYWRTGASFIQENIWSHLVIRHDGVAGNNPEISLNGSSFVDLTPVVASSGVKASDAGLLSILDNTTNRAFSGDIADLEVFNEYISQEKAKKLYLEGALRTHRVFYELPVSLNVKLPVDRVGPFTLF